MDLLFSSEDSTPPDDLQVEGPDGEEKLGILQFLERLEHVTDEFLRK